jgi:hypothetical protein
MATTSKRAQVPESFKDTRAPESDEEQWRDVGLSKNSKGEWVIGGETKWHTPICHVLFWTPLVVFFLRVSCFQVGFIYHEWLLTILKMVCIVKTPTVEEWNDPRAFRAEVKTFWKCFISFVIWIFAIMALDIILDIRSIDQRKLEELETGESRHSVSKDIQALKRQDVDKNQQKPVRTICGIGPYKAQSLVILIMPTLVLIGSCVVWYRLFISDAPIS